MSWKLATLSILLLAFFFRIVLIPVARHGDINNNTSWGQLLLSRGPINFYEGKDWTYSAPNQPPLYLYTFAATAFIQNTMHDVIQWANKAIPVFPSKTIWWFDSFGELYIAKLPGIFADLAIGFLIYFIIKGKKGFFLASVWLINPVSWYNSAIWGGTDSIVNLLGIISIYFLFQKKLSVSALFLTLSFLFKGSLLVFIPIYLVFAWKMKFSIKQYLTAITTSFVSFLVLTAPFHPNIDVLLWFLRLYTERFLPGEIGTLTANAFNFWWIVNPGPVLDNTLMGGFSARIVGLAITGTMLLLIMWRTHKLKPVTSSWFAFALISFVSFLFMTRIHERYLYPFFPIATISLAFFPWLWVPYVLLSGIHLLNLYHLFWAPGIPQLESLYLNPQFSYMLSFLSVVIFVFVFMCFIFRKRHLNRGK